ncbi:MAG TPA: glycerophosphodiester phosphodiesterase family protein [Capillimicrobium sp.]
MLRIAHRGASGHRPEHTVAAYDLAIELGADLIELDVRRTRDGEPVVLHDETLDRTVRGATGPVADRTLAEARAGDTGDGPVLTLREVLERYAGRVGLLVEVKPGPRPIDLERRVVELLGEHGLLGPGGAILQSFDIAAVKRLAGLAPDTCRHQLFDAVATPQAGRWLGGVASYATGIAPWHGSVDTALVDAAHAAGLAVHAHTVNDAGDMARLAAAGVDGIITDLPDRLAAVLETPVAA